MAHIAAREMTEALSAVQHAQHVEAQKRYLSAESVPALAIQHTGRKSNANQTGTDSTRAVAYAPLISTFPDATSSIDANTLKIQLSLGLDPASIRNTVLSANEDCDTTGNFGLSKETMSRADEDKEMADTLLHMLAIPKHIADRITAERRQPLLRINGETAGAYHAAEINDAKKDCQKEVTGNDRNHEKQPGSLQRGLSWAKTWLKQRNVKL